MFGRFQDQVAAREPQSIQRNYGIMLKKVPGTDKEINRVLMLNDFATGIPLPMALRKMQHDVLPTVDTPNIKISYSIEA